MGERVVVLMRAMEFAARAHSSQRRKGEATEPYVNHVIEVARLLAEATGGSDIDLILAGMLHDTLEDTETGRDEIAREFGEAVALLVEEVTDDRRLPKADRKRLQIEKTPTKSARAKLIKLADKTSNLRSMLSSPPKGWDRRRKREYFEWARRVVEGCRGSSAALEALFDEAHQAGLRSLDGG
jgi:(p)ppGpp synthase/HD superfamily hydrolase